MNLWELQDLPTSFTQVHYELQKSTPIHSLQHTTKFTKSELPNLSHEQFGMLTSALKRHSTAQMMSMLITLRSKSPLMACSPKPVGDTTSIIHSLLRSLSLSGLGGLWMTVAVRLRVVALMVDWRLIIGVWIRWAAFAVVHTPDNVCGVVEAGIIVDVGECCVIMVYPGKRRKHQLIKLKKETSIDKRGHTSKRRDNKQWDRGHPVVTTS